MRSPRWTLFLLTGFLLSCPTSFAQERNWQVMLLSGDTLNACRIDSLTNNMLNVTCDSGPMSIPVDSIAALAVHKEGRFWKGAGWGSIIGGFVGAGIAASSYHPTQTSMFDFGGLDAGLEGCAYGAVCGLLIGGIISDSITSDHRVFDLRGKRTTTRLHILTYLVAQVSGFPTGEK
jgi:hypothetical protein